MKEIDNNITDSQIIDLSDRLREMELKDYTEQELEWQRFFWNWGTNCKEFRKQFCKK